MALEGTHVRRTAGRPDRCCLGDSAAGGVRSARQDGFFDRDELDAGSNPADPASTPDNVVPGDLDGDGLVGITDFLALLAAWGPCAAPCPPSCPADLDGDCAVGITDFLTLLANWG